MPSTIRLIALTLLFTITTLPLSAQTNSAAHIKFLTQNVSTLSIPERSLPGPLCVFGPNAFTVAQFQNDKTLSPFIAAATPGRGRIILFPHNSFTSTNGLALKNNAQFAANAFAWAANKSKPSDARIGVIDNSSLLAFLKQRGFNATAISSRGSAPNLKNFNAIFTPSTRLSTTQQKAITAYINSGGGVVSVGLIWGWQQGNPTKSATADHTGNQLFGPFGLSFGEGSLRVKSTNRDINLNTKLDPNTHALTALKTLAKAPSASQLGQAAAILANNAKSIPTSDRFLRPQLAKLTSNAKTPIPTAKRPLRDSDGLAKVILTLQIDRNRALPPQQIKPHPAAAQFPGAIPRNAKRVTQKLAINTAIQGWHSTGLYAAPGQLITITLPQSALNQKLTVRIGAHKDRLWHKDTWQRVPEITRTFPITKTTTLAANAFGGAIFIDVPRSPPSTSKSTPPAPATFDIQIKNAVQAPLFVLDKTDPKDWIKSIRNHPAPWAELVGHKIALTVPSSAIRNLKNPAELMTFWDKISDAVNDLSSIPRHRDRPERYVTDIQISAGYMHSGYPIMTPTSVADAFVNLDTLQSKGNWGFFHEIGHNHQHRDWTFNGTTEVTCNLYSLYVLEKLCGSSSSPAAVHKAMQPANRKKGLDEYFANPSFDKWKSKPFTALTMYAQLQEEFGWETFQAVFAEYQQLSMSEKPRTDDDKRDQWLVRFSKYTGKNLAPFFEAWHVPTTTKAQKQIAHLPTWFPAELKARGFK